MQSNVSIQSSSDARCLLTAACCYQNSSGNARVLILSLFGCHTYWRLNKSQFIINLNLEHSNSKNQINSNLLTHSRVLRKQLTVWLFHLWIHKIDWLFVTINQYIVPTMLIFQLRFSTFHIRYMFIAHSVSHWIGRICNSSMCGTKSAMIVRNWFEQNTILRRSTKPQHYYLNSTEQTFASVYRFLNSSLKMYRYIDQTHSF